MQTEPQHLTKNKSRDAVETLEPESEQQLHAGLKHGNGNTSVQIDFDSDPTFVKTFRPRAAKRDHKRIFGLAVVDQELFVISQDSPKVEVYDSKTLKFKNQWHIKGLFDPVDISSCARNKCLYIFDWIERSPYILRIQPDGKVLRKWSTGVDGGYLSVTHDSNVILSVWDENKLNEYTSEGQLMREIQLSSEISEPRCAIKLTSGQFVVSHVANTNHRVCLVDEKGVVIKAFGGEKGSGNDKFYGPTYLTVDGAGFVLVADQNNKRVFLLSPDLKFKKELVHEGDDLRYPVMMHLDGATGRLFVADHNCLDENTLRDSRVLVIDFKIQQDA